MSTRRLTKSHPHDDSTRVNVLVTVSEDHRERLEDVAKACERAGMRVVDQFVLGPTLVGDVARADLARIGRVQGVASIEDDPSFTAS